MNLSLNWLKRHIDFDLPIDQISEILTAIGLEVEGVETFETVKGGLHGVVCGHVTSCGQHPNADRLKVTTVNIGGDTDLHVVCGAPNVEDGQKVWVATVGTDLYSPEGEKLTIKASKIRGEESAGMLCAEDELGLGSSHDGIMVLPDDLTIGTTAREYYEIGEDTIFDIGLTPNRSDATHHRGVAEDLSAYFEINAIAYKLLDQETIDDLPNGNCPVEITVVDSNKCPRYAGISLNEINLAPSPSWMKNLLLAIGVRPINNVVDITNFILHDMGQPLHAFDKSQIAGDKIKVQTLPPKTKFLGLDEGERELLAGDLMICDGNDKPLCIAGVFGGIDSGVTDNTTSLFLESAHFQASSVRVSSMKHNLRTDAAKVFEKGSDPSIVITALSRAVRLLTDITGAQIVGGYTDRVSAPIEPLTIPVRISKIEEVIGQAIGQETIVNVLNALSMSPKIQGDDDTLHVTIPTNKADVTREVDVIEEILRIYGFNHVEMGDTLQIPLIATEHPSLSLMRRTMTNSLIGAGYNEIMGLSLIESRHVADLNPETFVKIHNTSNIHLDVMRPNMLVSGLLSVQHNLNYQNLDLQLFELGKVYHKTEEDFSESEKLTVFLTGNMTQHNWNSNGTKADFYSIKSIVTHILKGLGLDSYQTKEIEDIPYMEYGVEMRRGPMQLGYLGKVDDGILKQLSIKQDVYYAELDVKTLYQLYKNGKVTFSSISKYPSVQRDLALIIDESVTYNQIESIIRKEAKKELQQVNLFDIYKNEEQLGKGMKSYAVNMTFSYQDRTPKDKEVDKLVGKIVNTLESKLSATLRS